MSYAHPAKERCYQSFGSKPYYMKQKNTRCLIATREIAVQFAYIQLNQRRRAYIVLDIDHERGALILEDAGLPPPTFIVHKLDPDPSDLRPNSVHVFYELTAPVSDGPNSRAAPLRFLEAVTKKLAFITKADTAYRGFIAKNPLSPAWHVTCCDVTYELNVLAEYVKDVRLPRLRESTAGRNVALFESVRAWVAAEIRCNGTVPDADHVWDAATELNQKFERPLPPSEVRSVSRSISRYAEKHGCVSQMRRNRGAMGLPLIEAEPGTHEHKLETRRRQAAGGCVGASRRAAKNEARVKAAIKDLLATGSKVTAVAVARLSGLSRAGLYKGYADLMRRAA